MSKSTAATAHYRPETRLVHAGTLRSEFGETSEGLFLTQGYVYATAELCEARFKGEDPGFLWRNRAKDYIQGKLEKYLDPKTAPAELPTS